MQSGGQDYKERWPRSSVVMADCLSALQGQRARTWVLLQCALAAAKCIVIGPVCGCACRVVGGSVTMITRNCVHRSSPNWVCR